MTHTKYTVAIRKNETGEIRIIEVNCEWHESSLFFWTEGHLSCDCNRFLEFERASGIEPYDDEIICGSEAYTVLYAEFETGERIVIDDVKPPPEGFGGQPLIYSD